jgi:hypothetical protein
MMLLIDIVVVIIVLIIGDGPVAFFILWKLSKRCGGVEVANG